MVGVRGAQLELDEGGHTGPEVIHDEQEGIVLGEHGVTPVVRREIQIIGHAVAVVVAVEEIGVAVAVGVGRRVALGAAGVPLDAVAQAVVVRVQRQRISVPHLAVVLKAAHLVAVADAVAVRVLNLGIRSQDTLLAVGEAVVVVVGRIVGIAVVRIVVVVRVVRIVGGGG